MGAFLFLPMIKGFLSSCRVSNSSLLDAGLFYYPGYYKLFFTEFAIPGEGDNYFVDCYLFTLPFAPEQVKIRPNEALEYKLATLEEIQKLAHAGIFLHYDSIKDVFAK